MCLPMHCDPNIYRLSMLPASAMGGKKKRSSRVHKNASTPRLASTPSPQKKGFTRDRSLTPYRAGSRASMAEDLIGLPSLSSTSSGEVSDGRSSEESDVVPLSQQRTRRNTSKTVINAADDGSGIVINFGEKEKTIKANRTRWRNQKRMRGHKEISSKYNVSFVIDIILLSFCTNVTDKKGSVFIIYTDKFLIYICIFIYLHLTCLRSISYGG